MICNERYHIGNEKLCKRFKRPGGTQTVLNKVNLQIYRGEMTAIRGKSGNGKSTLLNILAATMRADSGKVLYGDIDLQRLSNAGGQGTAGKKSGIYLKICIC